MTGATSDGSQAGVRGQGRRRARQPVPRTRRVEVTLTGKEYTVIETAARRAGLARRAYIAQAALTVAANGRPLSDQESLGRALIALMRAAGLVRRIGANISQAVAKLNATGQRGTCPATPPGPSAASATSTRWPTPCARPSGKSSRWRRR